MAENSKIEWTTHTFNPWRGCTKVSPGCANCYAETLSGRNPKTLGVWGPNGTRVVASEAMWREPLKWNKAAACQCGGGFRGKHSPYCPQVDRPRVFCASLADVFEDWQGPMVDAKGKELYVSPGTGIWVPSDFQYMRDRLTMVDVRRRLFHLIDATPNLDWLLLTKRPENIAKMLPDAKCPLCKGKGGWETGAYSGDCRCGNGLVIRPNVWLGVSVENQEQADTRIPLLLKTPAAVRFLSMEPLLGPVDLSPWLITDVDARDGNLIDWVIVGGESGPNARPMHPDWVRSIRDQCQAAGVPFFFKQWGEWIHAHPAELHLSPAPLVDWEGLKMQRVGKRAAGRLLDGREWSEIP
jgi:protein gp37